MVAGPNAISIAKQYPSIRDEDRLPSRRVAELTTVAKVALIALEILLHPVINIFSQGLADFLGLETLRHGTSLKNFFSIKLHGADPSHGGKPGGSSSGVAVIKPDLAEEFQTTSKGQFHVFGDSGYPLDAHKGLLYCVCQFGIRVLPTAHSLLSHFAEAKLPKCTSRIIKAPLFAGCVLATIVTPTLKFRFIPDDIRSKFEMDPDYHGVALRTCTKIGTDHLGLTGIFTQAARGNILKRMASNPSKTLWGALFVINPIGLALLASFGAYLAFTKASEASSQRRFALGAASA